MKAEGGKDDPTPSPQAALHQSIIDWLSTPAAYPDRPASVRHVETHISHVFLTDRFAYKLKKPVRFDFLDFRTLELRRQACANEVRLNRRLAPEVYFGLVAVREDAETHFRLDDDDTNAEGAGRIVEWLVKMHRLPEDATLATRIRAGSSGDHDADVISARLAEFYRAAPPLPIEPVQYRAEIERHLRANRTELLRQEHALNATAINRIHGAQLRLLKLRPELFDNRVTAGRVIDGHGDLRPEHIYLLPQPVVIDCIEFNAEFRHLDWADELSFLATECDFAGAEDLGQRIFHRTLAALNDDPPTELMAFYRSYRACVRAKVAALRARQQSGESQMASQVEIQRHLLWADRYDRQLPPPMLLVVCGLMGSGKSTLANALTELLGTEVVATDAIRRELFGPSAQPAEYGQGQYRPEDRQRVYDEMFARAGRLLDDGAAVILDAAFLQTQHRTQAIEIARRRQLLALVVHCRCPDEVALQRIANRNRAGASLSEARPELYNLQLQDEESSAEGVDAIEIDTTQAVASPDPPSLGSTEVTAITDYLSRDCEPAMYTGVS